MKINNGLYNKYHISKSDGTPTDNNADYFVLRLDNECKDKNHLTACRKAILVYADEIKDSSPELYWDLLNRYKM